MSYLVFDIETVPDVALGKRLLPLGELSDEDAARAMTFQHLQKSKAQEVSTSRIQ